MAGLSFRSRTDEFLSRYDRWRSSAWGKTTHMPTTPLPTLMSNALRKSLTRSWEAADKLWYSRKASVSVGGVVAGELGGLVKRHAAIAPKHGPGMPGSYRPVRAMSRSRASTVRSGRTGRPSARWNAFRAVMSSAS
jgi:hypothetical protein